MVRKKLFDPSIGRHIDINTEKCTLIWKKKKVPREIEDQSKVRHQEVREAVMNYKFIHANNYRSNNTDN